jgi:uncharacterized membrane protein YgaE (UPF0421/DUF939 family)
MSAERALRPAAGDRGERRRDQRRPRPSAADHEPPIRVSRPRAGLPPRTRSEWIDRFLGSDPGLNRLRMALQSVLTIAVILAAEALFVHFTHALQIPADGVPSSSAEAAKLAGANHEFLVIGMLLGAVVGLISSLGVMEPTARGQLVTMLLIPVPMVSTLALGIVLGGHRTIALVSLALILAFGTYCRRFGPRGFVAGMLLFMGDFFGFFLHGAVTIGDLGWLAAEIGVGLAVAIAIRFVVFYPHQSKALARTQRSYAARARKLASLALELFDEPEQSERGARRLRRQLVRLNEAALMIDAQLGDPGAVAEGSSGQLLHQRLFDVELALTNIARFAQAMARHDLPDAQQSEIRLALLDIVHRDARGASAHAAELLELLRIAEAAPGETDRANVVLAHRFAGSVIALADAMSDWVALGRTDQGKGTFQPAVMLFGGWLPGSTQVSAAASRERGSQLGDRARLAPYTRVAIQMGTAVGIAIVLGDLLSERRFYWAVIAAFITFMGANNAGEQTRKALYRVGGTLVGIAIGSLLANAVGHDTYWSLGVILAALFFGFYLMRINYAFMVVGITVMVSQLYVQLDEFSNSLLVLRLEETALGAGVAIVVVTLVLPLRTRRVLRVALRNHIDALERLVDCALARLLTDQRATQSTLRTDARVLDASYQALIATAEPLRRNLFGSLDEKTGRVIRFASAARNYGRNLVADVEEVNPLDAGTSSEIECAGATLRRSMAIVREAVNGSRDATYTRSSALFDRAERRLEQRNEMIEGGQLAIRDLMLVDGAMAQMAEAMGLAIADYDTPVASLDSQQA